MTGTPTRSAPATDGPVRAGGVAVRLTGAALIEAARSVLAQARADGLAGALVRKDPTLWGPAATPEASVRLGWLDAVETGRGLVAEVERLRDVLQSEGVDRVVLCATGGASLAPEALCATAGRPLVVVDSTDPGQVRAALVELDRTVVVVSSTSDGALETDSSRRAARAAFEAAGLDPVQRTVVVTGPGSPLEAVAREQGSRAVFLADPEVGGRYAALTAFGLVPAGLAGVDLTGLLDEAAAVEPSLASDDDNPALALGAVLGGGAVDGRDKLVLVGAGGLVGFGDWAEQLVAGSTGKLGRGLLPVVVESLDAPGTEPAADTHLVIVSDVALPAPAVPHTSVTGPLGAQLLVWEYATAVAARALQVNPFDAPDVPESNDSTTTLREGAPSPEPAPVLVEGGVEVHASGLPTEADDLAGALRALLAAVPERGYLAVLAYLDRIAEAEAARLRPLLARRLAHPVTFGWAPRSLHSTGQLHRGGPQTGVFLQVTAQVADDLDVPGRPYSFGRLQAAQALRDLRALRSRDRPVLHLHLADRSEGLATLLRVAEG